MNIFFIEIFVIFHEYKRIRGMFPWSVVQEGEVIGAKVRDEEGRLLKDRIEYILVDGGEKNLTLRLKDIYDWSSVQPYAFPVHKESRKLSSISAEKYMENLVER